MDEMLDPEMARLRAMRVADLIDGHWIHEIKHDGYRLMARRDTVGIRLLTPNGTTGRTATRWWPRP
jgi:ATP-dependent DNA ligase